MKKYWQDFIFLTVAIAAIIAMMHLSFTRFPPTVDEADAQIPPSLSVDLNLAQLEWTWVKGAPPTDGLPDEFLVKCEKPTGESKITSMMAIARAAPIRQVITGSGDWFCVVTAKNKFGESGVSNQVFFAAGATPSSPTGVKVTSK